METKLLAEAVNKVLAGTSSKGLIDGLENIVIIDGDFTAYNDRICISTFVPEMESIKMRCAVNANDLKNVLKGIKESEVDLFLADDILSIVSENTEAELPVLSDVENILKMIDAIESKDLDYKDLPNDFIEGLNLTKFNVSDDYNSQNNLHCLYIDNDILFSGDKYRLSMYLLYDESKSKCLIPKNTLNDLIKFNPIAIANTPGWAHFLDIDDSVFSCRTNQGTYPFGAEIFEITTEKKSLTLPSELKEVLESVIGLYDEVLNSHKGIKIQIKDGTMFCEIEKEKVWVKKKLKMKEAEGINITFSLSSVFLLEVLNYTDKVSITDRYAIFEQEDVFKHIILLHIGV